MCCPQSVADCCLKHFIPLLSKDRVPFSKTNMYKPLLENTFTLLKLAEDSSAAMTDHEIFVYYISLNGVISKKP